MVLSLYLRSLSMSPQGSPMLISWEGLDIRRDPYSNPTEIKAP
jgi:hypothetical protein